MKRKAMLGIVVAIIVGGIFIWISQINNSEILTNSKTEEQTHVNDFQNLADSAILQQGNPESRVTILAFLDYQCSDCRSWFSKTYPKIMEKLLNEDLAQMKFISSENIGKYSKLAAESIFCAYDQGKFPEYQEKLFSSQGEPDGEWVTSTQLEIYAREVGIDPGEFSSCLESQKYTEIVQKEIEESELLGITKTPVFIIFNNDGKNHIIKGGVSFEVFESVINRMNN